MYEKISRLFFMIDTENDFTQLCTFKYFDKARHFKPQIKGKQCPLILLTYPIGKISLIFSSLSRKMCQVSKKSYVVKPDFAMGTIAEILSIGDTQNRRYLYELGCGFFSWDMEKLPKIYKRFLNSIICIFNSIQAYANLLNLWKNCN